MPRKTAAAAPPPADDLAVTGSLPLYADARPILATTHSDVAILDGPENFAFAAKAPLIPITVDEFALAALDYPIVFIGPERRPFVVMGLATETNLFVQADGGFAAGAYVPAYLRRYPFVFARDAEDRMRILCLDQASDRVGAVGGEGARPLFEGGEPTELTRHALAFCEEMDAAEKRTTLLVSLIDEAGLFAERQAHHNVDGTSTLLLDYQVVDHARFDALDDAAFTTLRTAGALPAIYAHLFSGAHWATMALRRGADAR